MANSHLSTYLNDHFAGSVVAVNLLRDLETAEWGQSVSRVAAALRGDIEEDQEQLAALMTRLGVAQSSVRQATAWFSEKLTEVKLRIDDLSDGSLRLLEALELVALGIDGKHALWDLLSFVARSSSELQGPDYRYLIQRAEEQRRKVEEFRLTAGKAAFSV
jgi:hypothetical protein